MIQLKLLGWLFDYKEGIRVHSLLRQEKPTCKFLPIFLLLLFASLCFCVSIQTLQIWISDLKSLRKVGRLKVLRCYWPPNRIGPCLSSKCWTCRQTTPLFPFFSLGIHSWNSWFLERRLSIIGRSPAFGNVSSGTSRFPDI